MSIVDVKHHIHECLSRALSSLGLETISVKLDPSKMPELGDISSGVALSLAKSAKKTPIELAEAIQSQLKLSRCLNRDFSIFASPRTTFRTN